MAQVSIATVDSFQGDECDVILLSTVRSNPEGDIGFVKENQRINAAFTRARKALIV